MVKIDRSQTPPPSLEVEKRKACGKYNCRDVVEQLDHDFHGKCYICEVKPVQDPVVEHLMPHKNGKHPQRKFDWDNLFFSCGHCNSVKNQGRYDSGIIDCCSSDPEQRIRFGIKDDDIDVRAMDECDEQAVLTADLVVAVFNQRTTGIRTIASKVRLEALQKEMNLLLSCLDEYLGKGNGLAFRLLEARLDRKSAFAAFKRCYVREHLDRYPELARYVND